MECILKKRKNTFVIKLHSLSLLFPNICLIIHTLSFKIVMKDNFKLSVHNTHEILINKLSL